MASIDNSDFLNATDHIYINFYKYPEKITKLPIEVKNISELIYGICENDKTIINNVTVPICVTSGTHEAYMFIIQYMDFYKNKSELEEPPQPLEKSSLIEIFKEEKLIFGDLLEIKKFTKKEYRELSDIIYMANYMSMKKLLYKICAILAYYIRDLPSNELEEVIY